LFLTAILVLPAGAFGQKYELAAQFSGMHLHKIDEGPLGIGVRLTYNLPKWLAADATVIGYPSNAAGHYGETAGLLGIRAGRRLRNLGVFAKARPGVIHFGDGYTGRLDRKTHVIFDIGGVIEYYPSRRTLFSIDIGDTVIYYGSARFFNRPNPDALGTVHNFAPGFGFGIRW
jgi:hypothetical protein